MESTFLWQANLKSAATTVTNLITIFVSQLTSTFNFHFYAPRKVSSIYVASKIQALISVTVATAIAYLRCCAVLPMLLRKSTDSGRSISNTFSSPNNTADALVQQESKEASAFSLKS